MNPNTALKKRGRPVSFDYDTALDQAMYAFWQYGYEGTSMHTLVDVMQMNKASIYAAFGSKEVLFKKVMTRYMNGPASFIDESLKQPTAYAVVKTLLTNAAKVLTEQHHPAGCLVTQGALACSAEAKHMRELLSGYRAAVEAELMARFERAQREGDLSTDADAAILAKLMMTIHQGMSVQASSGASYQALLNVAAMAAQLVNQQSSSADHK